MTICNLFKRVSVLVITLASLCGSAAQADAGGPTLEERGTGPAMVFIPGLNSGQETFTDTCKAFEQNYRCVLVQLPGFAGQPPMDLSKGYLVPVRDAVIKVLRDHKIQHAVLVGHSLGGVLGMMIALEAPQLVDKLVLVESLPFAPANRNPALTAEQTKVGAQRMLEQRSAMNNEQYLANALQSLGTMSRSIERQSQLRDWVLASDRTTTTTALVEMMVTDLREPIGQLQQPTLVLGAWAAYAQYGSTLENTRAIYAGQYAKVRSVDLRMSEAGYHFLTWDDAQWVNAQIQDFLTTKSTTPLVTKVAGN